MPLLRISRARQESTESACPQGGLNVHFDPVMIRNGKREKTRGYREDIFFDEAMTFVDETKDAPFFCYLATYSPHAPLKAPEIGPSLKSSAVEFPFRWLT